MAQSLSPHYLSFADIHMRECLDLIKVSSLIHNNGWLDIGQSTSEVYYIGPADLTAHISQNSDLRVF